MLGIEMGSGVKIKRDRGIGNESHRTAKSKCINSTN